MGTYGTSILGNDTAADVAAEFKDSIAYGKSIEEAEDQLGTLEPGKYADLITLPRDPIEDVTAYQFVVFVMKGGTVFHRTRAVQP